MTAARESAARAAPAPPPRPRQRPWSGARSGIPARSPACSVTVTAASGRSKTWRRSTPGDLRPARPGPAPAAAARLVAQLPVRPGAPAPACCPHARPARPACGRRSFSAAIAAAAACPALGWTAASEEFRGVCIQPRLQLGDPLPGLRQLSPRLLQRAQRVRQFLAQRRRQPGVLAWHTPGGRT